MNILELTLRSSNIPQQIAFYEKLAGKIALHPSGYCFSIMTGYSKLTFESSGEVTAPVHLAFTIPENKWAEALDLLKQNNIPLLEREGRSTFDYEDWNARSVYFLDLDGNILEFIVRFNLRNQSTEIGFNLGGVVSISEVGLVAQDPSLLLSVLGQQGHWPVWKKYGDDFSAVGDEEGLFIVVKDQRHWFPTTVPANAAPSKIRIKGLSNPFTWNSYKYE